MDIARQYSAGLEDSIEDIKEEIRLEMINILDVVKVSKGLKATILRKLKLAVACTWGAVGQIKR